MSTILLADDNRNLADFLSKSLEPAGYRVDAAQDMKSALSRLAQRQYRLIILGLGRREGHKFLERMKAEQLVVPVIEWRENRIVRIIRMHGLAPASFRPLDYYGSELTVCQPELAEYPTRPLSFQELADGAAALLRSWAHEGRRDILRLGNLELDPVARRVTRGRREIKLSDREFEILHYLMLRSGVPVSRHELSKYLREDAARHWAGSCINYLRKKVDLPAEERLIFKKRGRGYQIGPPSGTNKPAELVASSRPEESQTDKDVVTLPSTGALDLSKLRRESDALLARMQSPESRAAMEAAFNATPEQLGKAALAAVRMRKRG